MDRVTVCVVDRSRLILEATKLLLGRVDFDVTAEASNLEEAIGFAESGLEVDMYLIDYAPAERDRATQLRLAAGNARVALFSTDLTPAKVSEALGLGLDGCVDKNLAAPSLGSYLRLIMAGERVVPYAIASELLKGSAPGPHPSQHLSRREQEILAYLADGLPNKLVAQNLKISIQTVKVHVRSILRKLGVQNRTEAALWATRNRLTGRRPGHDQSGGTGANGITHRSYD